MRQGKRYSEIFMAITYPKAETLTVGYDPKEDRLILTVRLQNGKSRKTQITRRLLSRMVDKMKEELASSHPAAHRSPDPEEVLRMEHIAAIDQVNSEHSGDRPGPEGLSPTESWLVAEVQIETQDHHLVLGLLAEDKEPIAGISLTRDKAYQVLGMLMEQAKKADWGFEHKIGDHFTFQDASSSPRVH